MVIVGIFVLSGALHVTGLSDELGNWIGHHGKLLVYDPGRYQFADFVKVGTPLTMLVAVVVVLLVQVIWH